MIHSFIASDVKEGDSILYFWGASFLNSNPYNPTLWNTVVERQSDSVILIPGIVDSVTKDSISIMFFRPEGEGFAPMSDENGQVLFVIPHGLPDPRIIKFPWCTNVNVKNKATQYVLQKLKSKNQPSWTDVKEAYIDGMNEA